MIKIVYIRATHFPESTYDSPKDFYFGKLYFNANRITRTYVNAYIKYKETIIIGKHYSLGEWRG